MKLTNTLCILAFAAAALMPSTLSGQVKLKNGAATRPLKRPSFLEYLKVSQQLQSVAGQVDLGVPTEDVIKALIVEARSQAATGTGDGHIELARVSWLRHLHVINGDRIRFGSKNPFVDSFDKDGKPVLLLGPARLPNVFNTLRLTDRQRAAKVLTEYLLPALKQVPQEVFNEPRLGFIGVHATYAKKDFLEEDSSPAGESLILVAPTAAVKKLAGAQITNEEFVASSDVYVANIDDFSKIIVTFE